MYMHSASQFGSLGPGSPGPGSTEYNVPAYSCFGLVDAVCCDIVQYTCNITMATHLVHHPGIVLYMMWMLT